MPTITIPAKLARAIVWGGTNEGKLIENRIVGTSRWSNTYEAIIEYQGKTYRTHYRVGATEIQEEGPWEDEDVAELVEVHQIPKTIMSWELVKD
jgi:hypothetical protein